LALHDLKNYSVLITGGGSGIGEGAARYLAAHGALVTISGRRVERINQVAKDLGDGVVAVQGDVTVAADRQRMVEAAIAHGNGLDGLVNNAGNMYRGPLVELNESELRAIFDSNVVAPMLLTGLATPALAKSNGAVVFLGSIHNRRAFPGVSPYAATKGAIEALTRSLAAELGNDQALARLQGMAGSHALGRIGTAEEVAEAITYLLQAQWTTGAIVDVDGGLGLGLSSD